MSARSYVTTWAADPEIAKRMIVSRAREKKRHALTAAAQVEERSEFARSLKAYLKSGGDVNALDDNGNRALGIAAFRAKSTVLSALLEAGADPALRDGHGYRPLRLVAQSYRHAAVDALLRAGAPVDAADEDGVTPLVAACTALNPPAPTLARLLAAGADPAQRTVEDQPLIHHVARRQINLFPPEHWFFAKEPCTAFIAGGGEIDARSADGRTALLQVVQILQESRVESWEGTRFLERNEVVITLRKGELSYTLGGKKKSVKNEYRWARDDCAEHIAFCNASKVALGLMKLGADPNLPCDGVRPLHGIFEVGVPALVRAAMKAGADPTLHRADGVGCVLLGVRSGHLEPVKRALKAGADPEACGEDGVTALDLAKAQGDGKLVKLLLRAGASPRS